MFVRKEYNRHEAYMKMESFCSLAEHCSYEIEKKLEKMNISKDDREDIITKLIKNKFIDNKRYARAFVREKSRFNKWGRVKIVQSLKIKQISSDDINNALDEIENDDYYDNLISLLRQKNKSIKASSDYERKGKLIRFAISRGFEMDSIIKSLDKIGIDAEVDF